MVEVLKRLGTRPGVTTELMIATLFTNLLALASPLFVIQVLNRYVTFGVDATLRTLVFGVLIAIVLEFGFREIRMRLAQGLAIKPDEALALAVFGTLTAAKSSALEQVPPGVRRQAINGVDAIQQAYNGPNIGTVVDVPFALLFLGALYFLSPVLALIASGFVLAMLALGMIAMYTNRKPVAEMQQAAARGNMLIGSAIDASDTVRAFNAGNYLRQAWLQHIRHAHTLFHKVATSRGMMQSLNQTFVALTTVAIIGVGSTYVVAAELDTGALIGSNILAARALMTVSRYAFLGESFAKARQSMGMAQQIGRLPMEAKEGAALAEYQGRISFQDLAFGYPDNQTPIFESLTVDLEPGAVLIVTGGNGTGKTTLARLIVGLIEPTRGRILADGLELQQVAPEWWRTRVSYLPQEPTFLNVSIMDNLKTAKPDADDGAVNAAINAVGLRRYISETKDGFDAIIEKSGGDLALGIRRRLALARALITDGNLIVLDEPTGGLDAEGCQAV
ncbi:MAG: ATP-binding cassette domain-containing protein, partial [Pseudomonadota bacterium]|nr:ATP-binding cassette domain-containing protein [Pseudomonadota bacterium]